MKNNKKTVKYILIMFLLGAVVGLGYFYTHTVEAPSVNNEAESRVVDVDLPAEQHNFTLFAQKDGQTAFDLAKASLQLNYKKYDFGVFITGINGIEADKKHFWAFYVNNKIAQKGVSQTTLKKGDKIEFKYEAIKK